jgi:hypothetical protein
VKTIEHEGLYFEYWINFILYVLANKIFNFESDIIDGTHSVDWRHLVGVAVQVSYFCLICNTFAEDRRNMSDFIYLTRFYFYHRNVYTYSNNTANHGGRAV